ncbi:MAG: hypothetical protein LBS05_07530 [Tannerellaceae bacterium]|jgi:hypothetical protein|nr:hypothetical protein [Tannerellaceae bacterium]
MKRSTIIFSSLLVVLFVSPFVVLACFYFFFSEPAAVVAKPFRTLRIENPSLEMKDVHCIMESTDDRSLSAFAKKGHHVLYYKGKETYLPTIWEEEDDLMVGSAVDAEKDDHLQLFVHTNKLDTIFLNDWIIFLNGEMIYEE